ncbi:receptor-like protein EIX2 [Coffea arabica]|uniref:Receptor-like protein EIX2 n=1 Tax=Coffea arabica TaxID=13443 RepID=A0ABM4V341_COFAR
MGTVYLILKTIVAVLSCVKSSALSSSQGNLVVRCNQSEKSALVKFREDCSNSMDRFSSWITEEDCCNWRGVMCSNQTGQWHVTMLDLRGHGPAENSQGDQVSDSLLDLPYLSYLDLSSNNFLQGQVPEFIGSLKNLEYLNLSNANFRGMIPDHLGNLSQLQYLDLSGNEYALRANKLDWLHGLSSLKVLELGGVDLSLVVNWLDAVNMLPSLVKLGFFACELNTLPLRLSAINFTQLQILDLSFNKFNSPMPYWLFNISQSLSVINFQRSQLRASIPDAFESMSYLTMFDLSDNYLAGEFPKTLGLIADDDNSTRPSLRELYLSNNQLKGSLPPGIAQLSELEVLDLASNSMDGVITEDFLNFSHLQVLVLSSNSFMVNISSDWTPPFDLDTIGLQSCQIGPDFPRWLQTQKDFVSIDISSNNISGIVPDWFWNISMKVEYMNLSSNNLGGKLPDFSSKLNLSVLDMSNNSFFGPLPHFSLSMMSLILAENMITGTISPICESLVVNNSLSYLDLSLNALSGSIPDCWTQGNNLVVLNLAYNNLSGMIPNSAGHLVHLKALILGKNALSGELPASLKYLTNLYVMDLGLNFLSGKIPEWIGENMGNLMILQLSYNEFDGNIPLQLCQLKDLKYFNLAGNSLSGKIPRCIDNFLTMAMVEADKSFIYDPYTVYRKALLNVLIRMNPVSSKFMVFDLAHNHLSGDIPGEITSLVGLTFLRLSNNNLTGEIPPDVGTMKLLEYLDLSRNSLSCSIPTSISLLHSLARFNLSYNNLSGKIPSGFPMASPDASSFIGNQHLCGLPLTEDCSKPLYNDFSCRIENKGLQDEVKNDGFEVTSFYFGLAAGFAVSFWAFWITLLLSRSCRYAYFQFLDKWSDKIYVMIAIKVARLRNKLA